MGKGDRKTAKGKRYNSSYGNAHTPKAVTKATGNAAAPVAKKAAKTVAKAPAKKADLPATFCELVPVMLTAGRFL